MKRKIYVSNYMAGRIVGVSDCIYFEANSGRIMLHYEYRGEEQVFEFRGTIKGLEQRLEEEGFVRIHRCYIVNPDRVVLIEKEWITLDAGRPAKLPLGKIYADAAMEKLLKSRVDIIL